MNIRIFESHLDKTKNEMDKILQRSNFSKFSSLFRIPVHFEYYILIISKSFEYHIVRDYEFIF